MNDRYVWRFPAKDHDLIWGLIFDGTIQPPVDGPFTNSLFIEFTTATDDDDGLIKSYIFCGWLSEWAQ